MDSVSPAAAARYMLTGEARITERSSTLALTASSLALACRIRIQVSGQVVNLQSLRHRQRRLTKDVLHVKPRAGLEKIVCDVEMAVLG